MFVRCIGTGSSGNCYALYGNDGKILLLDLGLTRKQILKGIDFNVSDVVGAVVSHSHLDHAKAVKDFENMGIPIVSYFDVDEWDDLKLALFHRTLGGFFIRPFPLPHNGTNNCGFLVEVSGQKNLYLTDFEYCKYNFKSLQVNHILIECNYQKELVERDLPNYEHKIRGHASLETCKSFIAANKTNALRTVVLCHMGTETTIAEECLSEVQKVAGEGVKCVCAAAGETVELSLYPF